MCRIVSVPRPRPPERKRRPPSYLTARVARRASARLGEHRHTAQVDSDDYLRRGVKPWPRRLHLALNYLPVIFGGIFLCLAVLMAAGVTNRAVALGVITAWVLTITEVLGRRPYIRRVGSQLVVRNIFRVHEVSTDSITGVRLHTFRLGKDTCPAIKTTGRRIPVFAYIGSDMDVLAADLGVMSKRDRRRERIIPRLGRRPAAKARRTNVIRRRS